jgi:hypothetical protein
VLWSGDAVEHDPGVHGGHRRHGRQRHALRRHHGLLGLLRGQRAGRRHGRVVVRRGDGGTRVGPVEYRRRQKLAGSEGRGGDLHGTVSGEVGARVERRRDDVTT